MDCRKWKLAAVGLVLLCGACGRPAGTVPTPTAVPAGPAVLPTATGQAVASPVRPAPAVPPCPPTEPSSSPHCDREALLAARDMLRGDNADALRTWQRDRPLGSFEGVRVDPSSGRVVKIEGVWLTPLVGSIPPQLGRLGQLQVLDLRGNRLTGSIPPELARLGQLQELGLSHNWLSSCIPPELGRLGQLQVLRLDHNQLTGAIPLELGQLSHLQVLNLTDNLLTGSIPSELGQLSQLQVLGLSHNRLSGPIPPELARLGLREWRDVPQNRLTNATEPERLNQPVVFSITGIYTDQTEHWGGWYRALRQGRQVAATLAVHRSPMGHGAPSQPLFRLPESYRPPWPITWTTAARPMTVQGRPLPEAPAVTVLLEARPDGTVHHLEVPTLDGAGYAGYRTAITWMAEGTDPLLMAGTFTPAAGAGTVRLVRLGDTVTATLALPPVDGLGARSSALLFTVPAGFRPVEAMNWTVPATAQVPVGDGGDPEAARGSALELQAHRDGRVIQVDPPRQVGFAATVTWRTADPGWMEARGTYVPTEDQGTGTYSLRRDGMLVTATVTGAHGVPPASVLFTVPEGFRPAQTVHRSVVVDAAGCHTRTLEVRPQGTMHLVGAPVKDGDEPLVHETVMTWTTGADLCQRHPWVQARLLQALRSQGFVRHSCAEVTWTDLASVKSLDLNAAAALRAWLGGTPPLQAHDLVGLTGLKTLVLQGDVWFPAMPVDLLVHAPALESLNLSGSRLRLSPGFLAHAPGLRRLTLRDTDPAVMPFLSPRLEVLDLEVPAGWTELPPDLLVRVPELRSLTLKAAGLTTLPPDLLVHVPKLRYLILDTPRLTALPVDFQTELPNLLEVRDPGGCAVSAMEPTNRPNLLARFLEACGNP